MRRLGDFKRGYGRRSKGESAASVLSYVRLFDRKRGLNYDHCNDGHGGESLLAVAIQKGGKAPGPSFAVVI